MNSSLPIGRPFRGIQGEVLEPGHHYEWAFLLDRWAKLTGRDRPPEVPKLIAFADAKGLDRKRRVAINGIRLDGSVDDAVARLWPQTERIRAYLIDRHDGDEARLREAIESLSRYLDAPLSGLWYENLAADGRFVVEAAPATSLYHIVGAIAELWTSCGAHAVLTSEIGLSRGSGARWNRFWSLARLASSAFTSRDVCWPTAALSSRSTTSIPTMTRELKKARLAELAAYANFHFEQHDLADRDAIAKLFAAHRFDVVIHLAAQAGVRHSLLDPHAYCRCQSRRVLERPRRLPAHRM